MSNCFTRNKWNAPKLCACGKERRSHQFDCHACHALAAVVYRARRAERARQQHAAHLKAIAENHHIGAEG